MALSRCHTSISSLEKYLDTLGAQTRFILLGPTDARARSLSKKSVSISEQTIVEHERLGMPTV